MKKFAVFIKKSKKILYFGATENAVPVLQFSIVPAIVFPENHSWRSI